VRQPQLGAFEMRHAQVRTLQPYGGPLTLRVGRRLQAAEQTRKRQPPQVRAA
jgi:hypothetical protein